MPDRLTLVRAALAEAALDGLYISCPVDDVFGKHSQNRRYVSGFTGSTGYVLVTANHAVLAVDFRYVEQAEREARPLGFEILPVTGRQKSWLPRLISLGGLGGKKLGLSGADLSYGEFAAMQKTIADMASLDRPELVPAPPIVEDMRRHKSPDEMALIQRAIGVGDAAFERVAAALTGAETEEEVALAVERAVRDLGAESVSFETIVAGGAWGAMPHASPRPEAIGCGQPVVIDMGAQYQGYCSDLTRTVVVGDRTPRFNEIYTIVFEAQRAAIEGVEPGMSGVAAHHLAADVIAAKGFGDRFGHGLGHGVGLQVHEAPHLGLSSEDTLEEGMVFTIEPGIYLPGWGGVRIEDVVVLENGHARVLSHATKLVPAGVQP